MGKASKRPDARNVRSATQMWVSLENHAVASRPEHRLAQRTLPHSAALWSRAIACRYFPGQRPSLSSLHNEPGIFQWQEPQACTTHVAGLSRVMVHTSAHPDTTLSRQAILRCYSLIPCALRVPVQGFLLSEQHRAIQHGDEFCKASTLPIADRGILHASTALLSPFQVWLTRID
jgi:hypothetical protein